MKKENNEKNQGFSLVLILISTILILTLGLTILSVSAMNIKMKRVDLGSKNNFYSAESAIDEINTGLEELVTEQIGKAYSDFLVSYSDTHPEKRKELLKKLSMDYVCESLVPTTAPDASERLRKLLTDFIEHTPIYNGTSCLKGVLINPITPGVQASLSRDDVNKAITIKDIYVEYRDQDYKSIIQTDIVISIPSDMEFSGGSSTGSVSHDLGEYAIIADQGLNIGTDTLSTDSEIVGNTYAGVDGINICCSGSEGLIKAENLITKGDIKVQDKAKLKIQRKDVEQNEIWANNIRTENNSSGDGDSCLEISGKCYVNNDLLLNAKKSNVKIEGTYNGYLTNHYNGNLTNYDNGSAIIINGKDSTLDMSGVSDLTVAGNAFIQVPNHDASGNSTGIKGILTGESITMKGNQIAYLVPEECISVGHNPVLWSEHEDGVNVNLTELDDELECYVATYKKIFYKDSGPNVVYYYIVFKNEQSANDYIVKYYEKNKPTVGNTSIFDNIKVVFPYNSILIGSNYSTNGSVTSYDPNPIYDPENFKISTHTKNYEDLYGDGAARANEYLCLTKNLVKDNSGCSPTTGTTAGENIVDFNMIKLKAEGVNLYTKLNPYDITIINNANTTAYEMNTPNASGLIIATGDVVITQNFNGLVIANGTVTVQHNAKVRADSDVVNYILNLTDPEINNYFYGLEVPESPGGGSVPPVTGSGTKINISNLLTYQNWRKK